MVRLGGRSGTEETQMNKLSIAAIAVASALLTPLVVNAAGRTEPLKPIVVAEATMTAASASQSATAPAPDGCTRRVRVVYAAAYQMPSGDCAASGSTN